MSQQEMEFEGINRDEQKSSYGAYVGWEPNYNATAGQKLSGQGGPSWGQRLALAIVSLCLWTFVLLALVGIGVGLGVSGYGSVIREFAPVFAVGLMCMTFVTIVVNVIFNRRR